MTHHWGSSQHTESTQEILAHRMRRVWGSWYKTSVQTEMWHLLIVKAGSPRPPSHRSCQVPCLISLSSLHLHIRGSLQEGILGWGGWGSSSPQQKCRPGGTACLTFFVSALGRVPKWGSAALSTGLLMSEGTDSVLRSLVTVWKGGNLSAGTDQTKKEAPGSQEVLEGRGHSRGRKDILQAGASFVHLL
jgi:hypothetical protein